jgi:hypothetical protein
MDIAIKKLYNKQKKASDLGPASENILIVFYIPLAGCFLAPKMFTKLRGMTIDSADVAGNFLFLRSSSPGFFL